ncbi:MAG TPA: hypothetical protein DDW94_02900 [Deltaproteobacteria bacterium]|nr:MAG: hypothetical protein A2Z79_08945 [Deltaproteobacteria bacterium GWA2_55_82]OGQ64593.1 MAG: hypothetical protein A3I81_11210 [Deltaproteobacteria bacterium RIFCSPLOWO2_02_FULL_55_12]OIJ73691.1 MAG: hypothetical protein A2V21_305080 [Deltaproteobacteria bacterium GWC2_55_46]HBG45916.1 hypothetical protein [Deltaproteobacteria bacterium]HCY09665.1 hypothetical protein [Deltaproteobacteria bacterium]
MARRITIAVLTYKRQDELIRTLESVFAQEYPEVEVIVINNHPDDTGALLKSVFPAARYIEMDSNRGCEARNVALRAATGDIVVTLDNDVCLKDRCAAGMVAEFFDLKPEAACLNFRVISPGGGLSLRDWCHPRDHDRWSCQVFQTDHISEGACAFRKEAFLSAGGYYAPFFIGHEGPDLCARLISDGWEAWYSPVIEVAHNASMAARPDWRAYYFNTRNNVWLAYRHYPALYALKYTVFYTAMMFVYSIRAGHLKAFLRGLSHAVAGIGSMERRPLGSECIVRLADIRSHKPSLASKIRKHLFSNQAYR